MSWQTAWETSSAGGWEHRPDGEAEPAAVGRGEPPDGAGTTPRTERQRRQHRRQRRPLRDVSRGPLRRREVGRPAVRPCNRGEQGVDHLMLPGQRSRSYVTCLRVPWGLSVIARIQPVSAAVTELMACHLFMNRKYVSVTDMTSRCQRYRFVYRWRAREKEEVAHLVTWLCNRKSIPDSCVGSQPWPSISCVGMFNSSSKACRQLVLRGATENALLTHWMTFQRVGSGFHSGPECSTSPRNLLSTHQVVILLLGKDPRLPKESLFHIHYLTTVNHLQLLSVELLSYSFIFHCAFKQSTCSCACSEKWQDSSFSTFAGNWSFTSKSWPTNDFRLLAVPKTVLRNTLLLE